jgi:Zn-dependent protease
MDQNDFYPEKPIILEKNTQRKTSQMLVSLILFFAVFFVFFSKDFLFVTQLIFVLLIHELGHFLMMKYFNYENVRMLFVPMMGAFVSGKKTQYFQKESLLVVSAGPIPGFIIGVVLLIVAQRFHSAFLVNFSLLFLVLNYINLLPLYPLDGGQFVKIISKRFTDYFTLIFEFISSLIFIGIGWYIDSWLMMIFGFYMGFRVHTIQSVIRIRKELKEEGIAYESNYAELTRKNYAGIRSKLLEKSKTLRKYIDTVEEEEGNQLLAKQVNSILTNALTFNASLLFKVVLVLVWLFILTSPFIVYFLFKEDLISHYGWYFQSLSSK